MAKPVKDVVLKEGQPTELFLKKHTDFIANYGTKEDSYLYGNIFYNFLRSFIIINVYIC